MAPVATEHERGDALAEDKRNAPRNGDASHTSNEDDEEDEEEPRLKYTSLTKNLTPVYRNGDETSTFLVGGDKLVNGTHNGNIHVLSIPSLQSLRVYHAHSASITAVSISPFPPPLPVAKPDGTNRLAAPSSDSPSRSLAPSNSSPQTSKNARQASIPVIPSNAIYIATASIDGNVCVASLIDPKDVILRNFGRPVQAVALSPEYKSDKSYVSGGMAGKLILTVGGRAGTSSTSNAGGGAAATASGWLGTIGLASSNGRDEVLHSGEGAIQTIKWSLSGKYVAWVNEQGIKIMRSNIRPESTETDSSWKVFGHMDHPNRPNWDEVAGICKPRIEWVDEAGLESDDDIYETPRSLDADDRSRGTEVSNHDQDLKIPASAKREKLVVGWGGTIWIMNVSSGGPHGRQSGERKAGRVDVVTILRTDCIISGVSLYTPNLLLVLAYLIPSENSNPSTNASNTTPKRGRNRRDNAVQPEMRIIDVNTKEEVCVADTLNVSRYERLSAMDYYLEVLPVIKASSKAMMQRGTLEVIGDGLWDATMYPTRLFSSAASVRSNGSNSETAPSVKAPSGAMSESSMAATKANQPNFTAMRRQGMKIFIQSPYDCVLATKPTISDHFNWLDGNHMYADAWELLNKHPEAASGLPENPPERAPDTPTKGQKSLVAQSSLADFLADNDSQSTSSTSRNPNSQAEKEKRRLGEEWVRQLVDDKKWLEAGEVCGRVLGTSSSWDNWIWVFINANKYDEITPYIPTAQQRPPLQSLVFEMVLGHYISQDRVRLKELIERWPPELYDVGSIITALRGKLKAGDIREATTRDGESGKDWRILKECLAKLHLYNGEAQDALRCYIQLQDAEAAMALISEYRLVDAVSDDIPGLVLLRVSKEQQQTCSLSELEELTAEPIQLLVEEAHHGIVRPETVIQQLQARTDMRPYLYFYFRTLWEGETLSTPNRVPNGIPKLDPLDHLVATEGQALVSDFADTAIPLFAEYDRPLLIIFLKSSQSYTIETAAAICEEKNYIPELVYLLSKEGRTKRALFLIIDKLQDVSQAISFAKEQDDDDLWNDLLDYSMNKPRFIRGLLEEIGTSINPITLVRRIPEGLEIEGLRQALIRMIKEYELQDSISEGVARVLRGEVSMAMSRLRTGQKKGIKFDIESATLSRPPSRQETKNTQIRIEPSRVSVKPGQCTGCGTSFVESEKQALIAFHCGHIYHLGCLLTYENGDDDVEDIQVMRLLKEMADSNSENGGRITYGQGVGEKIKRALRIQNRVRDGCPHSVHKTEA